MGDALAQIDPTYRTGPFGMNRQDRNRVSQRRWMSAHPIDIVVKCVCRECNHGWMNDIETAAQPTILRMMKGEAVMLDTGKQTALGAWICLKAILGQYIDPVVPPPSDWLEHLFQNQTPPSGWFIFTGNYCGQQVPLVQTLDYREDGILLTMVIKHFAIKVVAHPTLSRSNIRSPDIAFRIWPEAPLPLIWPPRIPITERLIDEFVQLGENS